MHSTPRIAAVSRRLVAGALVGVEGNSDGSPNVRGVFEHGCVDFHGEQVRVEEMAAFNAAMQLWNYVQMPALAIAAAVSSMAAQNVGAGSWDRVGKVAATGVTFNFLIGGALIAAVYLLNRDALGLFLPPHGAAIGIAVHLNVIILWSFLFFGMSMVLFGVVRATGAGDCAAHHVGDLALGYSRTVCVLDVGSVAGRRHMVEFSHRLIDLHPHGDWLLPFRRMAKGTDGDRERAGSAGTERLKSTAKSVTYCERPLIVRCGAFGTWC